MHEYLLASAHIHPAREPLEVRRLRRIELHRDVDVGHALRGNQFAFVREGVVGHWQREVDDDVEAGLSQRGEIVRPRHAARGQPVINAEEIADVVQRVHKPSVVRSAASTGFMSAKLPSLLTIALSSAVARLSVMMMESVSRPEPFAAGEFNGMNTRLG